MVANRYLNLGRNQGYFTDIIAGAAAQSVSVDGKLKSGKHGQESDRMGTNQGQITDNANSSDSDGNPNSKHGESKGDEQKEEAEDENVAEGLEAEEGDFVNVEVAFAYRARTTGAKDLRKKSKNAHLFLAFYLPGSIRFRKFSTHSYCDIGQSLLRLLTSFYPISCCITKLSLLLAKAQAIGVVVDVALQLYSRPIALYNALVLRRS